MKQRCLGCERSCHQAVRSRRQVCWRRRHSHLREARPRPPRPLLALACRALCTGVPLTVRTTIWAQVTKLSLKLYQPAVPPMHHRISTRRTGTKSRVLTGPGNSFSEVEGLHWKFWPLYAQLRSSVWAAESGVRRPPSWLPGGSKPSLFWRWSASQQPSQPQLPAARRSVRPLRR